MQEPLSKALVSLTAMSSVVLVIDALDECAKEAEIGSLIEIFSRAEILLPQLWVLPMGRPELPIRLGFSKAKGSYKDLILHVIPAQIVEHDIYVFFDDELKKIRSDFNMTVRNSRRLTSGWPGRPTLEEL
jgi:hypothetical protein